MKKVIISLAEFLERITPILKNNMKWAIMGVMICLGISGAKSTVYAEGTLRLNNEIYLKDYTVSDPIIYIPTFEKELLRLQLNERVEILGNSFKFIDLEFDETPALKKKPVVTVSLETTEPVCEDTVNDFFDMIMQKCDVTITTKTAIYHNRDLEQDLIYSPNPDENYVGYIIIPESSEDTDFENEETKISIDNFTLNVHATKYTDTTTEQKLNILVHYNDFDKINLMRAGIVTGPLKYHFVETNYETEENEEDSLSIIER